ncbi:MAG TPA: serine/threonine-protein kinase [Polyangiaceae bacterium]|jgi:serine/threonine-protein kinase|nr:serine/threonine-protein kinase [Polyangiaceae bacterium]
MSELSPELTCTPQAGLPLGTVIAEKYRVDGLLGTGGMGVVMSATNLDLDAAVAIKLVREEFSNNEEVVARMLQEARAAAKMHGAHMVRVLDVGRLEGGTPYIVMERLEGYDLATLLIERGALPIQEAVDYVIQACDGLAEAHALGIVHRDLKPENLFLATTLEGPVLKILDFGISKIMSDAQRRGPRAALTNAGCAVGSPYYMSPEQMRASPEVDARADIWSLGAVLFELLTGKSPFEGESVQVVCANVLSGEPSSLSASAEDAPEALDAILRRCLEKKPEARFESVSELAAALRDFVNSEGQSNTERGARLASGISLVPKTPEVFADPKPAPAPAPKLLLVTSTPTLPSRVPSESDALGHVSDVEVIFSELKPKYHGKAIAIGVFALALVGGAFATWQHRIPFLEHEPALTATTPVRAAGAAAPPVAAVAEAAPNAREADEAATAKERAKSQKQGESARPRRAEPARIVTHAWTRAASIPLGTASAKVAPAQPKPKSDSNPATASFDDLQAPSPSAAPAPINPWNAETFGGRY